MEDMCASSQPACAGMTIWEGKHAPQPRFRGEDNYFLMEDMCASSQPACPGMTICVAFLGRSVVCDNSGKHFLPRGATTCQMSQARHYYVYIMASRGNGTLYTGVTNDLAMRASQHRSNSIRGFTSRYGVHRLVRYEIHQDINAAIHREKCIKKWRRAWKLDLIEAFNPYWEDLFGATPILPSCHPRASGE
jgi:putative endonuclease